MNNKNGTGTTGVEILIAEDSPTQATHLRHVLEQAGYGVITAGNGREALAIVAQRRPAMVITDIVMPEMDGYELCQHMKSDETLNGVPVVVLTALSDAEDVIRALRCGTDSFVTKPYDERYLVSHIQQILANWPLQRNKQKHVEVEVQLAGRRFSISTEHLSALNLLLSTYEAAAQKNRELVKAQEELRQLNLELEQRVVDRTAALQLEIAERRRAEQGLREAAMQWQTTFDSATDMISIIDRNLKLVRVNRAFASAWKKEPEEFAGENCYLVCHGTNSPPADCPHYGSVTTGAPAVGERFEPQLGMYLEVSTSPIRDENGDVVGHVRIARDISERKRMQEQMVVTDRLASLGELVSGVAHEFNNPLTSICGFAQLLLGMQLPEEAMESIRIINSEADRSARIVRNLLTFARKHDVVRQPTDLNEVIGRVLEIRAYEQRVHNIEVVRRLAAGLPAVMCDSFQFQQVFLNIVVNAEYFMLEAHKRGTLVITTERTGDSVRISFADDGPGISPQAIGHIFDPFFTTKPTGKGTGLGLSICHGIVDAHGGKIRSESEPGRGATFIIELPVGGLQPGA